jgi:hypothetical protein
LIQWITDNWIAISLIAPAVWGLLNAIAKVTKTDIDNKILAFVGKVVKAVIAQSKSKK